MIIYNRKTARKIHTVIILFVLSIKSLAQNIDSSVFMSIDGPLIQMEAYKLTYKKPLNSKVHLRNSHIEDEDSNGVSFISYSKFDYIDVIAKNTDGDSALIFTKTLYFNSPTKKYFISHSLYTGEGEYTAEGGVIHVDTNFNKDVKWRAGVQPLSNTFDMAPFRFDTIKFMFYLSGKLIERSYSESSYLHSNDDDKTFIPGYIPRDLVNQIKKSRSEILIVKEKIRYGEQSFFLSPAVFFLNYD